VCYVSFGEEVAMKSIHVRLSDQEETLLQERAALSGKSVSEVVRETLFRDFETVAAPKTATFEQVTGLEKSVASLSEIVGKVAGACEKVAALEQLVESLSGLKAGQSELSDRMENAENEVRSLSGNLTRLVELQVEERRAPFGMSRTFIQAATLASFTLARGTFSNDPQAWEPYKEEARRRAYQTEGDRS
jgi:uncharacterized protein (DUF1778 family)